VRSIVRSRMMSAGLSCRSPLTRSAVCCPPLSTTPLPTTKDTPYLQIDAGAGQGQPVSFAEGAVVNVMFYLTNSAGARINATATTDATFTFQTSGATSGVDFVPVVPQPALNCPNLAQSCSIQVTPAGCVCCRGSSTVSCAELLEWSVCSTLHQNIRKGLLSQFLCRGSFSSLHWSTGMLALAHCLPSCFILLTASQPTWSAAPLFLLAPPLILSYPLSPLRLRQARAPWSCRFS
jgi:hypothetical protein